MSCCSGGNCGACKITGKIVFLLVTLFMIAALIGVWKALMSSGSMTFGTTELSLALLAAIIGCKIWSKCMTSACGCGNKAECCTGDMNMKK